MAGDFEIGFGARRLYRGRSAQDSAIRPTSYSRVPRGSDNSRDTFFLQGFKLEHQMDKSERRYVVRSPQRPDLYDQAERRREVLHYASDRAVSLCIDALARAGKSHGAR